MFTFIPNTTIMIATELEIMNSNHQYNLWASDKTMLDVRIF
ncbi:hypothetical protein [Bacillus sp. Marseille-Q3570]|nr:hypothetical protein [Bacillus sp. Marseille-Q3570]